MAEDCFKQKAYPEEVLYMNATSESYWLAAAARVLHCTSLNKKNLFS